MEKFYLFPGGVFANKNPHIVDTILGSCIAVVLFDPILNIGSMNHFMLPFWNKEGIPSNKYGDIAVPELIKKMLSLGSSKNNLRAKVFGGSEIGSSNGLFHIGQRNIDLAFELLKKENIPIISHNVGGKEGRKIIFYSSSGEVMVRLIKQSFVIDQITKIANSQ